MGDEEFDTHQFCKALNRSRSNLFRKLKALTEKSATRGWKKPNHCWKQQT